MAVVTRQAAVWAGDPVPLGYGWGDAALIGGEEAAALAEAAHAAGAPPVAVTGPGLALLSRQPADADLGGAAPGATGLADGAVSTVVLRHAWTGPESLTAVVDEVRRILAPGGRALLADWDLHRVLTASPRSYPDAFFYAALPEVADRLRMSMAFRLDLALSLGRAGFTGVRSAEVDEVVAEFAGRDQYLSWLRERGFRGSRHADLARLEQVREALPALVRRLAPIGGVVHREPWRVVSGIRPA